MWRVGVVTRTRKRLRRDEPSQLKFCPSAYQGFKMENGLNPVYAPYTRRCSACVLHGQSLVTRSVFSGAAQGKLNLP